MARIPYNIERIPGRNHYTGYGAGIFRITGSAGQWSVCQYRNSREAQGLAPARYIGEFRTLAEASNAIAGAPEMPEATL